MVELTAGENERVDGLELRGRAHRGCLRAATAERHQVFPDVALEGENADPQDGQFPLSGRERSVPGGAGFASFAHHLVYAARAGSAGYQPRVASNSPAGMEATSSPGIALPSPALTSAMTSGLS